ncbi:Rpn family recombination-promoting nuclease/putative transposase [Plectonema cf. radiosum LEGE 06105]|uniref:Rpn family recombination-promoting nuclease/putative transposase n=1 Tax=Plectonema cf. radiosum LEGE 06105 TaxID=945769 RepID=A0A8J7EZ53_9CYAN|nr:Rpn family recombination-promoting nuclease/putative transposase [Plectonema radiosum]MBE9211335.1 Rpn family recombination-promoting nuclease/putative transposase [Plectonema cf. radiosum LEGE 06105]
MRRDSIFYKLFQQSPNLLFELLTNPPENADEYRFDSVAVKEPKFEIDGVFLPPENQTGVVYFVEVQFQQDKRLYERVFAESHLYFYRNRERFNDLQIVIIYPSRSIEQDEIRPFRSLLNGDQVNRIYLDELGNIRSLPLWVALMVLTTIDEEEATQEARYLLTRSQQEAPQSENRAIMELITTIMVYKFEGKSQKEVEEMLGITLQETRVYREIKEEGRSLEAKTLILRLLTRRVGELPQEVRLCVESLSLEQLENLGEALLDFQGMSDLDAWLEAIADNK